MKTLKDYESNMKDVEIIDDGILRYAQMDNDDVFLIECMDKSIISLNLAAFFEPKRLVAIGQLAFEKCQSLSSITIPKSVTEIGPNAFTDCHSLIIFTEHRHKPIGWHADWNNLNRPVKWDYSK